MFRVKCPACKVKLGRAVFLLYPFKQNDSCPSCGVKICIRPLSGMIGLGLVFIPCIAGVVNYSMKVIHLPLLLWICFASVIVASLLFPFITKCKVRCNDENYFRNAALRNSLKFLIIAILGLFAGFANYYYFRKGLLSVPGNEPVFAGSSQSLNMTVITPTLNAPLQKNINVVWCASFLASWKHLEASIAKEPIALAGALDLSQKLNSAVDPRPVIPAESLYVASGWNNKGIVEQIKREMSTKFPHKAPPVFPGIVPDSIVSYCYLETSIEFKIPYFQSRKPMMFKDSSGKETALTSFGIREKDEYAYRELRGQPKVLYIKRGENQRELKEFAIDLDQSSKPNQIILAVVEPQETLGKTIKVTTEKIVAYSQEKDYDYFRIGINDSLLIPDIAYNISHHFEELEDKMFTNSKLKNQRINVVKQDIKFTLNRSGAELSSESKMYCSPIASNFFFNRPFLIIMKKRGAESPFFAMWVDNTELLKKW